MPVVLSSLLCIASVWFLAGTAWSLDIRVEHSGGLLIGHWVGGLYVRGNSLWNNGRAIAAPATIGGATHDIFIDHNVIDCSLDENIYMTNVDSGHLKGNWLSCAGGISGQQVFGVVTRWALRLTQTVPPPPVSETAQIFARPSPEGKMQVLILWPNGTVGVLATEP